MATINYTTVEGERWDSVSFRVYGDAGLSKIIAEANPNVLITDVLAAGTKLDIPILEEMQTLPNSELLPPWQR
jgi:phage tail protein X